MTDNETNNEKTYTLPANKQIAKHVTRMVNTLKLQQEQDAYEAEDIENLWKETWASFAERAPATRSTYTSYFRNAVRDVFGRDHPALTIIRPLQANDAVRPSKQQARANSGRMPKRRESIENLVALTEGFMSDRKDALSKGVDEETANTQFQDSLREAWEEELVEIQRNLSLSSQVNVTSQYRTALRQAGFDDDLILDVVKAPETATETRRQDYLDRIVERNNTLIAFTEWQELLSHVESLLPEPTASWSRLEQEAKELGKKLDKEAATEIGAALLLITGRRSFEVFCQGKFEPAPIELDFGSINEQTAVTVGKAYHNWQLIFSGQAKTRGRVGTKFDTGYVIPVLAPAKTVYFAHMALKNSKSGQEWSEMTSQEFKHDMLISNTERCLLPFYRSAIYAPYWPEPPVEATRTEMEAYSLTNHNIRSLYTEIADVNFRRKNMSKNAFMSQILGHGKEDLASSHSYMRYNLPDIKPQALGKRVKSRLVQKFINEAEKRFQITPTQSKDKQD